MNHVIFLVTIIYLLYAAPASVQNIYLYRAYLDERIVAFQHLKRDYVKETSFKKEGRLRHLSVSEGLLKETPALQRQIENVLKCKVCFIYAYYTLTSN